MEKSVCEGERSQSKEEEKIYAMDKIKLSRKKRKKDSSY